jgi:Bacterial Ig-like domain/L,D-transpeptidase catalytic domain
LGQQGGDLQQDQGSDRQRERGKDHQQQPGGDQQQATEHSPGAAGNGPAAAAAENGPAPGAAGKGHAPAAAENGHAPAGTHNGEAPAGTHNGEAPAGTHNGEAPAGTQNGRAPGGTGNGRPPAAPGERQPGRHRGRLIGITTAIVAVLAGGGAYALSRGGGQPAATPQGGPAAASQAGPMRVMSVTPASGAQQVDGSQPVRVTFSAPVSARSPRPSLTPAVAGNWQPEGDAMVFTPATPLSPSTQFRVTIPAGVRSSAGQHLGQPTTAQFSTASYSTARLAQILGQLGYLPMTWQQPYLGMRVASAQPAGTTLAVQEALAYDPPSGLFTVQPGYPASLAALWQQGTYNVVLQGAVMAFQSQHNMNIDGNLTPALWNALFQADMSGTRNPSGYTYAVANKGSPETLTIWHNGQVVLSSPANTGIPAAPTVDGTFPVYERFLNTIMSGTNPDGSHYSDPVSFVSYFNGGDAVHYFPRGSYGSPQSLGCVELPYNAAEQAYPFLTYGSLVTVQG